MACCLNCTWPMLYWFPIWIPLGTHTRFSQCHMYDIHMVAIWLFYCSNYYLFRKFLGKFWNVVFAEKLQLSVKIHFRELDRAKHSNGKLSISCKFTVSLGVKNCENRLISGADMDISLVVFFFSHSVSACVSVFLL